jgi:Ca2+-transporting ATPase
VNYLLSANLGEVLIIFLGVILGSFLFPETFQTGEKAALLTPIMLLWINFITDGLPALALGADPKSDGIMEREPRGRDEPVINKRIMASIGSVGMIMTVTGLALYFYLLSTGTQVLASTALFTFVVAIEMARIQVIRRRYSQSLLSNKWLLGALISSLGLQALVLYSPLKAWFETQALSLAVLGYIGVAALAFVGLNIVMSRMLDNVVD